MWSTSKLPKRLEGVHQPVGYAAGTHTQADRILPDQRHRQEGAKSGIPSRADWSAVFVNMPITAIFKLSWNQSCSAAGTPSFILVCFVIAGERSSFGAISQIPGRLNAWHAPDAHRCVASFTAKTGDGADNTCQAFAIMSSSGRYYMRSGPGFVHPETPPTVVGTR